GSSKYGNTKNGRPSWWWSCSCGTGLPPEPPPPNSGPRGKLPPPWPPPEKPPPCPPPMAGHAAPLPSVSTKKAAKRKTGSQPSRCRALPDIITHQRQLPCRPPGGGDRQKALSLRASRLESRSRCRTTTTTCRRLPRCRQLRPSNVLLLGRPSRLDAARQFLGRALRDPFPGEFRRIEGKLRLLGHRRISLVS